VRELRVRRGSGGAGAHRGGDGLVRALELRAPLGVSVLSQRRLVTPFGLAGGLAGACGRNERVHADGRVEDLGPLATFRASPGDVLRVLTPGGGGWGAARRAPRPLSRPPDRREDGA
jgi:5-oxoprolinase (ATP-hydrolysing)